MTLQELFETIGEKLPEEGAHLSGLEIHNAASLDFAGANDISFYADTRYRKLLNKTRAGVVLVPEDFHEKLAVPTIRVASPATTFAKILEVFRPPQIEWKAGIHPTAVVSPEATIHPSASIQPYAVIEAGALIGENTVIGAHCYIGHQAKIGANCHLYPHVFIGERCILHNRVVIHAGTTIGADGFGYEFRDGRHHKIPQTGNVEIMDDVEIGANSSIDRARFGRTLICEGVKIDNLVQVGHNVQIGPHSILCGQVGISGSARLGAYVTLAGKVGINGHIELGDGVTVAAMAGVVSSIPSGQVYAGLPALPIREFRRNLAHFHRIEKLVARVNELERIVEKLQGEER
ncbi:MAG: UDP-3-O-(3-hydroxymyristoyl)glucosamine N-acyltransferase [Chthoniobacterales bacterium]|nr:UDP-3-O-(3-hydroxymyristoyl)glucosamine N-acyltransferase [Chthoniobacterales bacterium]